MYNTNSHIKFKTSMLKSILCDSNDAYIAVKGTIQITQESGANPNNNDKEVVFKNCAPLTYRLYEKKQEKNIMLKRLM